MSESILRELRQFTDENPELSRWYVLSTCSMLLLTMSAALLLSQWFGQLLLGILAGLLMLRFFVIYHDFLHGAILRKTRWANYLFTGFSVLLLTPPKVWKETHNYHHAHNVKMPTSHIGSFKVVTMQEWQSMKLWQRLMYRIQRHPITMLMGALTVFIYGMCIAPFLRNPKKHWGALVLILIYVVLVVLLVHQFGFFSYFCALLLPQLISAGIGAYLFYAQHNFPGVKIYNLKDWSFNNASLYSSSYMSMSAVMHWFTANIGYHHIHHLNPAVPFYRLPEAMQAIPALQKKPDTSLTWSDIKDCIKLNLWSEREKVMLPYPE